MVIHDQVDWRNLEDSLVLDVSLIESIFYNLSKVYDRQQRECQERLKSPTSDFKICKKNPTKNQLDDEMFAKADVLKALEDAEGYLNKRPWLRVLHTRLACVSFEKEGINLQNFVRYRQRDRNICLKDVRRRLETIYADAQVSIQVEETHKNFIAQARAVSPWCVRDFKCLHPSPAQLYKVHVLPIRPVTEEELQKQREYVLHHARAVVNAAVGTVLDKMLAPCLARPKSTAKRTEKRPGTPSKPQARAKREQAEREVRIKSLRLDILAPAAVLDPVGVSMKGKDQITLVMMQLATVEAQGDPRLARKLLENPIVQSGIRRAAEQAKRLEITEQTWEVVKLWRELYRSSTLQALETSIHG
ncbi:hypothetical protein P3T76_007370 [Phytophthora citrophthora]|uniref:Uncharacterized protein n=1 Tax=Phytophthora citrophthora TaxID=4793 RepID=A0AAD9GMD6_9STRA|nr:hypothetical protein P3T76_007370 [Phytophthora citrophthora]